MVSKKETHRFTIIIDKEMFEEFKILAQKENRSASNMATKLIADYIKKEKSNS